MSVKGETRVADAAPGTVLLDGRYPLMLAPFVKYGPLSVTLDKVRELGSALHTVRVIITTGDRPVLDATKEFKNLSLVALIGSGFEAIEVAALAERGVAVTYSPGANADDVATHAVALLLAHNRTIIQNDARVRAGLWRDDEAGTRMRSVSTLKVGVVGLGAIGRAIAHRMKAFGSEIAWWGPRPKPEVSLTRMESVLALATWSDVLFLAQRADKSNEGMINREVFAALGPRGVVVNITRGLVINEADLVAALETGELGGAALDVFAKEPVISSYWRDVPNTVFSPHCAATGTAAHINMISMVKHNLDRFFAGQPLANPVPGSLIW
jgi:lactate dehydrogenase-like 2-hydroxyacid dehydrogenase